MNDVYHTKIYVEEQQVKDFFNNTLDGVVKDVLYELTAADEIHLDPLMCITKYQVEDRVRDAYGESSTHVTFFFSRKLVVNNIQYGWDQYYIIVETMLRVVGT
jgi:hypothetical protein